MVAGQEKMETQVKELKESIQSLNKFAIAIRLHHLLRNLTAIANLFKDGMDSFNSLTCVSIFFWPATISPSNFSSLLSKPDFNSLSCVSIFCSIFSNWLIIYCAI